MKTKRQQTYMITNFNTTPLRIQELKANLDPETSNSLGPMHKKQLSQTASQNSLISSWIIIDQRETNKPAATWYLGYFKRQNQIRPAGFEPAT